MIGNGYSPSIADAEAKLKQAQKNLPVLPSTEEDSNRLSYENFLPISEMMQLEVPPIEPLISGLLNKGTSMMLTSVSGGGKSLVGLNLSLMAASTEFNDVGLWNNGSTGHKVLYLDAEVNANEAIRRIGLFKDFYGDDVDNLLYWNRQYNKEFMFNIHDASSHVDLLGVVEKLAPDLVVFDNYRSLGTGGGEESSSDTSELFNTLLDRLSSQDVSSAVIHHNNKAADKEGWTTFAGNGSFTRPYSSIVNLKTNTPWDPVGGKLVIDFKIDKVRSDNIEHKMGVITLDDNRGMKVQSLTDYGMDSAFDVIA